MPQSKHHDAVFIVKRLYRDYIKNYRSSVAIALACMVLGAVTTTIIVKLLQPLTDLVFIKQDKAMYLLIPFLGLFAYSLKGLIEFCEIYIIEFVGQKILADIQLSLYKHLIYSDIEFIAKYSSARLISRFTNDIALIRRAIIDATVGIGKHAMTIVFLIIMMFYTEFLMSCMTFLVFPIILYIVNIISKKFRSSVDNIQEELSQYNFNLDESFETFKLIKSCLTEEYEIKKTKNKLEKILLLYKGAIKYTTIIMPLKEIFMGLAMCFITLYGGMLIFEGKSTPGSIVTFISAFAAAYKPFGSVLALNSKLQEGIAASARIFQLLDSKAKIESKNHAKDNEDQEQMINNSICLTNLNYAVDNISILHDVNVDIKAGSLVAVVGASGSGKTTLINLLLHFVERNSGEIIIGGKNISSIDVRYLRHNITLVSQENILFDGSIFENITYGTDVKSLEEVIEAAKLSYAHDFIEELPEKYNTIINISSLMFSGGQRQKIALARAFLRKTPILLLDEAASALDTNTEIKIYDNLKKFCSSQTIIVISHRLTSIEHFNNILVMHKGEVVESGSHKKLMSHKSIYFQLYSPYLKIS